MQATGDLVFRLGLFYLFILLGYLFARLSRFGVRVNKLVTVLLINALLPVLILQTILGASAESLAELPVIVIVTILMHISGFPMLLAVMRGKSYTSPKKGSMLLCVTFNNGIFLPIPLILLFIGEAGIPIVAFFSITQMILFATLGAFMGSAYSSESTSPKALLRKVVLFPPFLAAIAALCIGFLGFVIPAEITPLLSINGIVTTYLALFAVGLGIGVRFSIQDLRAAVEVFAIRQVLVPVIVAMTLGVLMLSSLTKQVLLLEALMPPAVITVVYAAGFDLDVEVAATVVTVGTLLLLPIVPFLPFLLGLF